MKRKNEENWANDIKRSIDKGRIGARRKIRKSKRKFFSLKMSVGPPGIEAAKSPCSEAKKRATGARERS